MTPALFSIGYEGAPQSAVIKALAAAGVELVIDVRAIASSRRPGFSKSLLQAGLAAAGVDYAHFRTLGTPKAGRQAVRAGRPAEMLALFADHMATATAREALEGAIAAADGRKACLLCYEADWRCCHRAVLADMIGARSRLTPVHLRAAGPTPV